MDKKIRAFYAIDINDEVRGAIQHVVEKLKTYEWSEHVRWTTIENLHLTLRFLGDVTEPLLEELHETLAVEVTTCKPFSLMFKEPRLFPHFKKPRVIAAGVAHNEQLAELAEIFERCAVAAGLSPETRQFKGHLTLGRCKKTFPRRTKIESLPFSSKLPVTQVALYQSTLDKAGPIYTRLKQLRLGE